VSFRLTGHTEVTFFAQFCTGSSASTAFPGARNQISGVSIDIDNSYIAASQIGILEDKLRQVLENLPALPSTNHPAI